MVLNKLRSSSIIICEDMPIYTFLYKQEYKCK